MTGLTFEEAEALIKKFFDTYMVLSLWLDSQKASAMVNNYTASVRGRRRFYELYDKERVKFYGSSDVRKAAKEVEERVKRCAGNQPIQTSCVDLLKPAMVKIYLALRGGSWTAKPIYDARIVLSVHDEIVCEACADHAEAVKGIMEVCMQESYDECIKTIKNKVDVTIADYWKK